MLLTMTRLPIRSFRTFVRIALPLVRPVKAVSPAAQAAKKTTPAKAAPKAKPVDSTAPAKAAAAPKKAAAAAAAAPPAPVQTVKAAKPPPASKEPKKKEVKTRSPTAYNLFLKEQYPKIKAVNPASPFAEVTKAISGQWKLMSESAKERYYQQANSAAAQLAPQLAAQTKAKLDAKRPPNAYATYVKEQFPIIKQKRPAASFLEVSKEIRDMWRSMSPASKQALEVQAKKKVADWQIKQAPPSA